MAKEGKYFEGIGRRKRAVARVRLWEGKGEFTVNNLPYEEYFTVPRARVSALTTLKTLGKEASFTISAKVNGGGKASQADAIKMGIARALVKIDSELHVTLAKGGFLKRDPREKERKKYGLKKARKRPQFTKR